MRIVTAQELESWLATGKVLEKDGRGPKVVALENGLFLKIFHTRRHPLLARWHPAAKRFAENAHQLQQLEIQVPEVQELLWIDKSAGLSACLYRPLPGTSVEDIYNQNPDGIIILLPALAKFIRTLHKRGVYFRSLHLGNIIQLSGEQFGLIDILDLQFKGRQINRWLVQRNLRHLQHYLNRRKLTDFPLQKLVEQYRRVP
ncbi:toluene tolerance protein [Pseudomonas lopnurensis]|uniref:toluene tolerance protein n=1 Tax=Pseudomonas lopnurensis TaxID=1477517 RepID=UPI0028B0828D|nr:toluene tolerance protein [Pseudomonas lopnurensis]